jgi:hypothetical protein
MYSIRATRWSQPSSRHAALLVPVSTPGSLQYNIKCPTVCFSSRDGRGEETSPGGDDQSNGNGSFGKKFGDEVRNFFDFANWAPRSSQAWRLGGLDSQGSASGSVDETEEDAFSDSSYDVLSERVAEQRRSMSGSVIDMEEDLDQEYSQPSFLKSTDEEFAESLNSRITEVAGSSAGEEEEDSVVFDGETLLDLIEAKFGKKHDVSFVRRDIPGKTLVSLNVYHAYLGQKSFPMSEEDFKEKMDGVALALSMWDQVDTVVGFLKSPVRSSRGLPSRPIVGNAVSISLELTKDQIREWWGR